MLTRRNLVRLAAGSPLASVPAPRGLFQADERDIWPTERWPRTTPERVGLDRALLLVADEQVPAVLPDLSALLVVRNGFLVFERYYNGHEPDAPLNVRSITKSAVSALVGMALDEGLLTSLDQTIGELIPDRVPDNADPLTPTITVRKLLTMTSGWAWDISVDYPTLIASENWAELTLSLPVADPPGTFYAYNTGGSHLLSVILQDLTGQETADYAAERLFAPLGIGQHEWQESPQGESCGGFGLFLTPQEMAKLGFLFLKGGRWEDAQLVPADYAAAATTYQSAGDSTGLANYGYQWWVTNVYGLPSFFALGYGSQYVYVVPDLDLIVVAAVARRVPAEELRPARPLIENYVVAAALQG
jgi:CubicO group peptidase (beta-lactamase class C family)